MMEPKPGQVWKDTVNGDLLLVQEVDPEWETIIYADRVEQAAPRYARCLAFCAEGTFTVHPGMKFMGMQEMQFKHFDTPRFKRLVWFKMFYYSWKMKEWVKEGGM